MTPAERMAQPHGQVFAMESGSFVRFLVGDGRRDFLRHQAAIDAAKRTAKRRHLKVLDVAGASQQRDGSWIVELQVRQPHREGDRT